MRMPMSTRRRMVPQTESRRSATVNTTTERRRSDNVIKCYGARRHGYREDSSKTRSFDRDMSYEESGDTAVREEIEKSLSESSAHAQDQAQQAARNELTNELRRIKVLLSNEYERLVTDAKVKHEALIQQIEELDEQIVSLLLRVKEKQVRATGGNTFEIYESVDIKQISTQTDELVKKSV